MVISLVAVTLEVVLFVALIVAEVSVVVSFKTVTVPFAADDMPILTMWCLFELNSRTHDTHLQISFLSNQMKN